MCRKNKNKNKNKQKIYSFSHLKVHKEEEQQGLEYFRGIKERNLKLSRCDAFTVIK